MKTVEEIEVNPPTASVACILLTVLLAAACSCSAFESRQSGPQSTARSEDRIRQLDELEKQYAARQAADAARQKNLREQRDQERADEQAKKNQKRFAVGRNDYGTVTASAQIPCLVNRDAASELWQAHNQNDRVEMKHILAENVSALSMLQPGKRARVLDISVSDAMYQVRADDGKRCWMPENFLK